MHEWIAKPTINLCTTYKEVFKSISKKRHWNENI